MTDNAERLIELLRNVPSNGGTRLRGILGTMSLQNIADAILAAGYRHADAVHNAAFLLGFQSAAGKLYEIAARDGETRPIFDALKSAADELTEQARALSRPGQQEKQDAEG